VTAPLEFEEQEGRELEGALAGFSEQPPLVCFPMRAEWEKTLPPAEKDPHPEPEFVSAWASSAEAAVDLGIEGAMPMPLPILRLAERARESAWEVRARYARGHGMHATQGKPTALRHSIALAFGRHPLTDRQAVAVYEKPVSGGTWSWSSIWVMGPDLPPCGALSLAGLEEFLEDPQCAPEWFAGFVQHRAEQDAAAKKRAKERPKKARSAEAS
jgi:hypothetical protein